MCIVCGMQEQLCTAVIWSFLGSHVGGNNLPSAQLVTHRTSGVAPRKRHLSSQGESAWDKGYCTESQQELRRQQTDAEQLDPPLAGSLTLEKVIKKSNTSEIGIPQCLPCSQRSLRAKHRDSWSGGEKNPAKQSRNNRKEDAVTHSTIRYCRNTVSCSGR